MSRPCVHSVVFLAFLATGWAASAQTRFPPVAELPAQPDLPDPLVMFDGKRVTSKQEWFDKRRPELKDLFAHYMYGYLPPAEKVTAKVERVDRQALGGKATLKEATLASGPPELPAIHPLPWVPS